MGSRVYVADGSSGVRIIDCADPGSPRQIGVFDTGDFAAGVAVNGNTIYTADRLNGLRVADISDVSNPREIGHYDQSVSDVMDAFPAGDVVYVVDRFDGLTVLDVSDP